MKPKLTYKDLFWEFANAHPDNAVVIAAVQTALAIDTRIMDWEYILDTALLLEQPL